MAQRTKCTYRTIKNPACDSKRITVKEVIKAAKECKKKKMKNYLLAFGYIYYDYDKKVELKRPFSAKNVTEAKEIAKVHLQHYKNQGQIFNPVLREEKIVAKGKELLN